MSQTNQQQQQPNPTATSGEAQPRLTIKFSISYIGVRVQFKMRTTTDIGKAMDAFAIRLQCDRNTLRFVLGGRVVEHGQIPGALDMEDGASVEVYCEQKGGGDGPLPPQLAKPKMHTFSEHEMAQIQSSSDEIEID